jgi:tripartite-type tricarboxylate transporter receptor subunit TctC
LGDNGNAGNHLYAELFKSMTGIEMTHVPYKGGADAIKDVVAGHMQVLFPDTAPSIPLIRSGTVTVLGVSTLARLPAAQDIPPLSEVGVPGFDGAPES